MNTVVCVPLEEILRRIFFYQETLPAERQLKALLRAERLTLIVRDLCASV